MKRKSVFKLAILLAGLSFVFALSGAHWTVAASLAGEAIDWWVHAGGGAPSGAGDITLNDSLGQAFTGGSSAVGISLGDGYWYGALGPPRVALSSFEAFGLIGRVQLSWITTQESDLLGFNLYRSATEGGVRVKLNSMLIPAQAGGSPTGAQYSYFDEPLPPGAVGYYWLEMVTSIEPLVNGPRLARVQYGIYLPQIKK